MNAIRTLTLALGLAAVLASPTLAQQRPGGQRGPGRGSGSMVDLLMAEPVQQELELSDEQVEKLQPIGEKYRSEMMSRMQEMRDQLADLSPEERRGRFEQMSRELNASAREELAAVLKPEQVSRLEQIQLQIQGVQVLTDPEVAEKLALTDEQKTELGGILESYRTESRSIMEAARGSENFREAFGKLAELRDGSMEKAKALLTEEQQATWKEMTGEPFEIGRGGFGRGGFGPGGRPGAGGRPPADN